METKACAFNVSDRVTSKQTGMPMCGTVIGVLPAYFFIRTQSSPDSRFTRWNNLYPDWTNKFVYLIEFDSPQKASSIQDMLDSGMPEDQAKISFRFLHSQSVSYYPEDDLEAM